MRGGAHGQQWLKFENKLKETSCQLSQPCSRHFRGLKADSESSIRGEMNLVCHDKSPDIMVFD